MLYNHHRFSYRLELMRQIYNSSDSPPDSFAIYQEIRATSPDASSVDSDQTTPTNPPNEFNMNNYFFNSTNTGHSNDIFQCFQTTCASVVANSSRLSLANLIPSRQANLFPIFFIRFSMVSLQLLLLLIIFMMLLRLFKIIF